MLSTGFRIGPPFQRDSFRGNRRVADAGIVSRMEKKRMSRLGGTQVWLRRTGLWIMGLATAGLGAPAAAQTFSNPASIAIPGSGTQGPASPYPSVINATGVDFPIVSVSVSLVGLSHTYPGDIHIMLVTPDGTAVMLMSDTGGSLDVSNVDLTFDDFSPPLPSGQITSGTYAPTNYGSTDMFPAPAPFSPNETALSAFVGRNANGTWAL
jgi:hypothetical protein